MTGIPKQRCLDEIFFSQAKCYHIRITLEELDMHQTFKILSDIAQYLIVSEEYSKEGKLHQHILFGADESVDNTNPGGVRDIIRCRIYNCYPVLKDFKQDKHNMNKYYSIKEAKNKTQLKKYVLKEGNYLYKGFTKEDIDINFKLSFTQDSKKRFNEIREQLIKGQITLEQYAEEYIKAKAVAEQNIYMNHVVAHVLTMGVKIGEIDSKKLSERIMEKIYT